MASNFVLPSDVDDVGQGIPAPTQSQRNVPRRADGSVDFTSKLSKKYNVTPLTPPPPQQGGFDIGGMLGGAANAVGNAAGALAKGTGDVFNNAANVAQAANPFSGEDMGKRAQRLGETALNVGRTAIQPAMNLGTTVAGGLGDVYQGITGAGDQDLGARLGNFGKGFGRITGAGTDFVGDVTGMNTLARAAGLKGSADGLAQFYGDTGKAAGTGAQKFGEAFPNIAQGIGQVSQGDQMGWDNILRKGLFQGVSGASNAVFSPISGAMGTLPDFAKQGLGEVAKAGEYGVDSALSFVGLDPKSVQGQNMKAGLQALMDIGSLGAGKVVGGALKSGKLGTQAAKAAAATSAFTGKAANTFNNAVGKAFAGVKKGAGKAGDFALNTTSNALLTTPAATMKKIYENGDDFLRVIDDPITAQARVLGQLQGSLDDALTRTRVGGKGYDALRKSTQKATLPIDGILSKVDDFGLELVNGKLRPKGGDIMNSRMTADDIAYLNKNLLPQLPVGKALTPAQYLNQRKKLDALAKYDMGIPARNDAVRSFVSDMRMTLNDSARTMFDGLGKLDDVASEGIRGLKELRAEFMRKDPVTKQYVLKRDIQPETISNLLSPRNRSRLSVLEKNAPGITRELEILDLVKQVDRAANITTGAGLKRLGSSMAGGGLAGPVGALAGYLVSDPTMVAKMFARMGSKLGAKTSVIKGGVTAAGETVKGAKETVKSAMSTAKGKGKLSNLTQESINAMGQTAQPQPPQQ